MANLITISRIILAIITVCLLFIKSPLTKIVKNIKMSLLKN